MVDYEEKNQGSDWNEQQLFANAFFNIDERCRYCQTIMEYIGWYRNLLSKVSLIMSVAKGVDIDKLNALTIELKQKMGYRSSLLKKPKGYYCPTKEEYDKRKEMIAAAPSYDSILFDVDARVNQIANTYMPFLNIGKKHSIKDL